VAATNPVVTVVDLAAQVRGNERTLTLGRFDDVHLSNAGHRVAADLFWKTGGFDRTGPNVELISPQSGNAPRPVLTIRATVTDDSGPNGVARVVLLADGTEQGDLMPRPDLGANVYLGVWDGRLAPGPHRIGVAATDHAGNRVESVADVVVGQ
jgi:Bacterial Ig domain